MSRAALRSPIGHCLVIGALLFVANRWWTGDPRAETMRPPIVISAADLDGDATGIGSGDASERARRLAERIDDEVLLREALARGFDREDGSVRSRLLRLGRYLGVAAGEDEATLEREARALGLELSDLTVRRHLIEMMRLAAGRTGAADLPSDEALLAYYAERAPELTPPDAIRLTHIYLSRARRGSAAEADAVAALAALRDGAVAAESLGDPFARGAALGPLSMRGLDEVFGPGFADAVAALPTGTWAGPIPSSYGVHLVRVEERVAGTPPPLAAVRSRLVHELLRARSAARLEENLRAWRARYPVRIEAPEI